MFLFVIIARPFLFSNNSLYRRNSPKKRSKETKIYISIEYSIQQFHSNWKQTRVTTDKTTNT